MGKIRDIIKPRDLPQSGPLSMSQIVGEFKKGNTFSSYYGAASGIPASPPMSVSDFYGKSDGYAPPKELMHPDSEQWVSGPDKSVVSRIANTNINTYFGVKYPYQGSPSNGGDPIRVKLWNEEIRKGVQGKLGTSVPAGSSAFASFGTQMWTVTGWVYCTPSGSTMDGKLIIYLYDEDDNLIRQITMVDIHVPPGGKPNWDWRAYSVTITSYNLDDDKMAKWIHGGCKMDLFRTTAQYTGIPTVSTVEYYLDFKV
jgi:hypothetical protein